MFKVRLGLTLLSFITLEASALDVSPVSIIATEQKAKGDMEHTTKIPMQFYEKSNTVLTKQSSYTTAFQQGPVVNPTQFLLDQIIWGESYYREDLVKNALSRLQLIAPDNDDALAAEIRLAIRQKQLGLAEKLLEKLKQKAPDSKIYKKAQMSLILTQPEVQQKLQHARVLSLSGHAVLAKEQYDALFKGIIPTPELDAEYWTLVLQIPQQRNNAFNHLQSLYEFLKIHHIYPNNSNQDNWLSRLQETLSRLWVSNANIAFQAGNLDLAQKGYQQAILFNHNNYSAWDGLGDVAFAHKNFVDAEKDYKQAFSISPTKKSPIYGLFSVYKHESLQKALHFLESLPEDQKIKFQDEQRSLQSDILQQQAEKLIAANKWNQGIEKYSQAQKIDPDNVWLIYHLALALHHVGKIQKANDLFLSLAIRQKKNPAQVYAYALYLSSLDYPQKALTHLHTLPETQWNKGMRELSERLNAELILQYAQKLRDNGEKKAAIDYLMRQKQTIPIKITLADWAFLDNDFTKALHLYQDVIAREPQNADANLGAIETLIALKDKEKAYQMLKQLPKIPFNINMQRRIANAWYQVGEPQKSLVLFRHLKQIGINSAPSQNSALLFRDAARVETQLRAPKLAQDDYKEAMVKSEITSVRPANNDVYTLLTRNHVNDDWLKRSIRSDAAQLYQQQETRVTLNEDYWRLVGTAGTSDLRAGDTIAQADWGLYNGRAFLRADAVTLGAGTFSTIDGVYFDEFGTCNINGCTTGMTQRASGISWDGGWQNSVWGADIGQTPVGFPVSNWVGGVNYSGEIGHVGWTLTASRRPMTNSLLSFAGAVDPNTGITWGGVVATGLTLSLSYDRGEANGFWANIIASRLTGKNVETNQRILLMDGYYYKLINEDNRRFIIGLTNMVWHYDKNVYAFTLGQSGYYSPNSYLSFTIPIDYRKRTANWSYELGGTVTWSRATTKNLVLYPLPYLVPNLDSSQNTIQTGGSSIGYGYSILALLERRLGSHFIIGGLVNLQQSTDYTPSHLSLFLRYSFEGWQGNMDMPIVPLIPYSDFR